MRTIIRHRVHWVVLLSVIVGGLFAYAESGTEGVAMTVTRSISTAHALPDSVFTVTLVVKAETDLFGAGIREVLPIRWKMHPVESDGAAFKRSEGEWVFDQPIEAGTTRILVYEVAVPAARDLLSDSLPECFSIQGTYQATVPSFETPTLGESTVEIVSTLPIATAIAHLVPASAGAPDAIDLRLSPKLSEAQLTRALQLWQRDTTVPGTGGERIDLAMINHLAALYETCTRAQDPLPLSVDPRLEAVRTIDTFLPCDSVLLPEGCFDPGSSARKVTVRVHITPASDAYGVTLKEWFPTAWRVTPLEHEGFWYRPSAAEWVYPTRVSAGEALEVTYVVEVLPTPSDHLMAGAGCCAHEMLIVGEASSALECSVSPVSGEEVIHVESCLPVILAISRWDVDLDRFDAKLSDAISFPQVQRAVRFWQESLPVPHTCGYTVGYETLKRIVAYWLSGSPVTGPFPRNGLTACDNSGADCATAECLDGWLCQMTEMQDPDDFVGLPDSPKVLVDGGPDRVLTCAQPSTTLTAVATGGVQPFQFEWVGPSGQSLGETSSIQVSIPGEYTVLAVSCGGCLAADTVTVLGDSAAPSVQVSVGGELTGHVKTVDLTAVITGGTAPIEAVWSGSTGERLGDGLKLSVSEPGAYVMTATGANGCAASAFAAVAQDIEPPAVDIEITPAPEPAIDVDVADAVLTCAVPEVLLCGKVSGGREPYTLVWTDSQGTVLGDAADLTVGASGTYCFTVTGANGIGASASVTVREDLGPPAVSISGSGELNCTLARLTLQGAVEGGRAPYVLEWTDAAGAALATGSQLAVEQPGTYTLKATGANGCSASAQVTVTKDTASPVVSASGSGTLTCATTEVKLTVAISGGRAPYEILWLDSVEKTLGTTESVSVVAPGTYRAIVTGSNGCSSEAQITVAQDIEAPVVEAAVDGALTCAVTQVNAHANIAGGRAPFTISWLDPAQQLVGSDALLRVSKPGIYTVRVVGSNGCAATARVTVTEDVEAPSVSAQAWGALTCAVTQVELSSTVSGGRPPYAYSWTNAAGAVIGESSAVVVAAPGSYRLTVRGANGCTSSGEVAVTQDVEAPTVAISAGGELTCAVMEVALMASVTGGRTPYVYRWTNEAGQVVGNAAGLTVDGPGRYRVKVTGANGCSAEAEATVTQDIEAPRVSASVCGALTCFVTEVSLTSSVTGGRTPYVYRWTNEAGKIVGDGAALTAHEPGRYTVTVTGSNGCAGSTSVVIEEDVAPPCVTLGGDRTLTCSTPAVFVDAAICAGRSPFTYTWTDDCGTVIGTTEDITLRLAGVYTLIVTGSNGCSMSASLEVFDGIHPPTVDAGPDQALACVGDEVTLDAIVTGGACPYEFTWVDSCDEIVGTTEDLVVTTPGVYILTVRSADGCIAVDSVVVTGP